MMHSPTHGRGGLARDVMDFTLFRRAGLMEPLRTDSTIAMLSFDSAGAIAFGTMTYLRMGRLASVEQCELTSKMDPRAEFSAIAHGMLRVRFDIEKEVLGTGSPFMVFKTDGERSAIGLHCLCASEHGGVGTASMVLWTFDSIINDAYNALAKDPVFAAGLPLVLFDLGEAGVSLSMKGSIAALYDGRHTEILIR